MICQSHWSATKTRLEHPHEFCQKTITENRKNSTLPMTAENNRKPVALALFAHPDDVEFTSAGTLELLRRNGFETHYADLADGCCGSMTEGREAAAARRWEEARAAAHTLGATPHPPLFHDLGLFYNETSAARVAALVRRIQPNVILTHALRDYMEDHMTTARLACHAAFVAGIPNYRTNPEEEPYQAPRAVYHALPHGLRYPADGRRAYPAFYIGIDDVLETKRDALACHASQKEWLDQTQGMDAYLTVMESFAATLGGEAGHAQYAEAFTRHLPIGLADEDYRPLEDSLADRLRNNENYPNQPGSLQ